MRVRDTCEEIGLLALALLLVHAVVDILSFLYANFTFSSRGLPFRLFKWGRRPRPIQRFGNVGTGLAFPLSEQCSYTSFLCDDDL